MRKPTILAVDDTRGNLVALEAVLDSDYDLVLADSGAKAIEILQHRNDVAVVLMDVQMPVMDGFEAARRIKELPNCHGLPIVFITAVFNEDPYVKRGYEVGGVDYFTKPFDLLARCCASRWRSTRRSGSARFCSTSGNDTFARPRRS